MSSSPPPHHHHLDTEEMEGIPDAVNDNEPVWDPVAQIYVGGRVPETNAAAITSLIQHNNGTLFVFGYGSLCWNPGKVGDSALAHPTVSSTTGKARGYRRAWAQKSTDHRGRPSFPGIVCTLLKQEEYETHHRHRGSTSPTRLPPPVDPDHSSLSSPKTSPPLTEGVLYKVPPELVDECLQELDFREKGGYARDVIDVVEDETGQTVQALLYRGTPDNPAFWPRALRDLPFAAAVMASSVGPSGENIVYLNRLDEFLEQHVSSTSRSLLKQSDDTFQLASMAHALTKDQQFKLHFLCGCGSNQHNQLLLQSDNNAADLADGQDAHKLKEMVICMPAATSSDDDGLDPVVQIAAGGGHSAVLTRKGRLYLFGWNESGQLGNNIAVVTDDGCPLPIVSSVPNIDVSRVALGFSHTLVVEKVTGRLFAFGDDSRGQVTGEIGKGSRTTCVTEPITPVFLEDRRFVSVAAGLFHSAAVDESGDLVTFGCGRFGQSLSSLLEDMADHDCWIGQWNPGHGVKLTHVACGRRHTVALDDQGQIWTFGDNKYGQLGRATSDQRDSNPQLVELPLGRKCLNVACGWSHTIVLASDGKDDESIVAIGWGRNDKGQLGSNSNENILEPRRLFTDLPSPIDSVSCGSEFTVLVDKNSDVWGCGWNEHGNIGSGGTTDVIKPEKVRGAPITTTPRYLDPTRLVVAGGGSHLLAMRIAA